MNVKNLLRVCGFALVGVSVSVPLRVIFTGNETTSAVAYSAVAVAFVGAIFLAVASDLKP